MRQLITANGESHLVSVFVQPCVISKGRPYMSLVNVPISLKRTGLVLKSYKRLPSQIRDKFKQSKSAFVALSCSQVKIFMHMYVLCAMYVCISARV